MKEKHREMVEAREKKNEFDVYVEKAVETVRSWPAWKQSLFGPPLRKGVVNIDAKG
jgi:hypothetical protein